MNAVLLAIVGYVLAQFLVGVWVSRRISTASDYILAGRKLGGGLVLFSVFATFFGAEAIVATGGSVYEKGLAGALVDPFGYALAIVVVGLFFAGALWSRGITTFADLFRQRYSPGVERLVVLVLLPGSLFWAAAQLRAFGQVMDANSGMGLRTAIVVAAVLVAGYSVVGGLLADAVTDLIQGMVVLAGLVILGTVVAVKAGGVSEVIAQTDATRLVLLDPTDGLLDTIEKMAVPICGTIVAVEIISRFLGARSANVAVIGTVAAGIVYLAVGMIPVFLGLAAARLLPNVPEAEQTVARLAEVHLPGLLYIAFVGAIISANLSVVHSALHAPAAQLSHNIVVRVITGLSDTAKLWTARLTVLALSIVAFILSFTSEGIHELIENASAFGSAGVFVATLFALFTTFGGPASAYASIAAGMVVWVVGKFGLGLATPYLLGLSAALIGYVGAALIERRR
jgi:Na+/proline symporter